MEKSYINNKRKRGREREELLQKKTHQPFLGAKRRSMSYFSAKNTIDDEELGLTFSRRFCFLELNVDKVGEISSCDSSFRCSS
jgi:hypothetical protein